MTPDELEKEAERIGKILIYGELEDAKALELLQEMFRAVHDAAVEEALKVRSCDECKREGFNEAKEKAAKIVDELDANGGNIGSYMAKKIRALKIGEGE